MILCMIMTFNLDLGPWTMSCTQICSWKLLYCQLQLVILPFPPFTPYLTRPTYQLPHTPYLKSWGYKQITRILDTKTQQHPQLSYLIKKSYTKWCIRVRRCIACPVHLGHSTAPSSPSSKPVEKDIARSRFRFAAHGLDALAVLEVQIKFFQY